VFVDVLTLIGKRLLQAIPVLFAVTFLVFTLLNILPGGSAVAILGLNATPQLIHELNIRLGLDHPFLVRYFDWLRMAISGNFGTSLASLSGGGGISVSSIIAQRLPVSAELGGLAFVESIGFAIPVAVLAARHPRQLIDRLNIFISMFGFLMSAVRICAHDDPCVCRTSESCADVRIYAHLGRYLVEPSYRCPPFCHPRHSESSAAIHGSCVPT